MSISPHLDNNFNLLRLVAASSVIFSHAYDITSGLHDPLSAGIGYSAGWVAVSAFFSMSGYLIYKSALRTPSAADYMAARCLRILPGLWTMLIITTLALSSITALSLVDYLGTSETWEYIFGNAIMYMPRYELPGVFLGNPLAGVINGSLWTLRFEFTCYILVIALSVSGFFSRERWFRLFAVVTVAGYLAFIAHALLTNATQSALFDGNSAAKFHRLGLAFLLGMFFARYRDGMPVSWAMLLGVYLAAAVLWPTPLFQPALIAAIAVTCFKIAFAPMPSLDWAKTMPDVSYGVYIYAFPVQQVFAYAFPQWSPLQNSLASLPATLLPAILSWYLVEKPALRLKGKFVFTRARA